MIRILSMSLAALLLAAPVFAGQETRDGIYAPRADGIYGPVTQDEIQAPRGQDVQAPRGQDVYSPRSVQGV